MRGEKALRAISLHWERLEERGWGSLAVGICSPAARAMDKCDVSPSSAMWTGPSAVPLLQLMTSHVATLLKADAGHEDPLTGSGSVLQMINLQKISKALALLLDIPDTRREITEARTSVFFLLAPRMACLARAAVSRAAASSGADKAEALIQAAGFLSLVRACFGPQLCPRLYLAAFSSHRVLDSLFGIVEEAEQAAQLSRGDMLELSNCSALSTVSFAARVHRLASCGCEEAPAGSAQLRDLLAQPVLSLLGSPLLDQLAMLQHALTVLVPLDSSYRPLHLPPLVPDDVAPGPSPDSSQAGPGGSGHIHPCVGGGGEGGIFFQGGFMSPYVRLTARASAS